MRFFIESLHGTCHEGHEQHDKKSKRAWYAEFGGRHDWIVDGFAKSLECLILQGRTYVTDAAGNGSDVVSPASLPGLKLPLAELWGDDE